MSKLTLTPQTKQLIIERLDKVRLLEVLGASHIVKAGHKIQCTCPIHRGDNETAFNIFPDTNWVCWTKHCENNEKQDCFSLVKRVKGFKFPEAVLFCAQLAGIHIDFDSESTNYNPEAIDNLHWANMVGRESAKRVSQIALDYELVRHFMLQRTDYMESRGFTEDALNAFEVGHCFDWMGFTGEDRVTFPVLFDGKYVGLQGRCTRGKGTTKKHPDDPFPRDKKYDNLKDFPKQSYFYNFDRAIRYAQRMGRIVICEGVTDVIKLHQYGLRNAVCPLGSSVSKEQMKLLWRGIFKVVLMLDRDSAGSDGMKRFIEMAKHGCDIEVAILPDGKDPAQCTPEELFDSYGHLERVA